MVRRGSRDLFRLTECFDKLKESDTPTKYAEELVALHDLFTDGLDVVKNGVLPRKKMESALMALHGVEACLTQKGGLDAQADNITSRLKWALGLLRQTANNHLLYERVLRRLKDAVDMENMDSMVATLRLENSPDAKHKLYRSALKEMRSQSFPSSFDDVDEGR